MSKQEIQNQIVEQSNGSVDKPNAELASKQSEVTSIQSADLAIVDLLQGLSPDQPDHVQHVVGVYLYQQVGGDQGFELFNDWRTKSSDYPGSKKLREFYNLFAAQDKYPVTESSLKELISVDTDPAPDQSEQSDFKRRDNEIEPPNSTIEPKVSAIQSSCNLLSKKLFRSQIDD